MDTYEIVLNSLVYGGDALGRLPDGRAAFVPFALPGEKVRIQVIEEKRGHVRASLLEVLEASPQRISPRCVHFGVCGGCHYQHMDYADQLKVKQAVLCEQLERIGGLQDIPCMPAVASPQPWYYRNHVQFHQTPEGKLGYQAARSNTVIAIRECHLPETPLNETWPLLDMEHIPGLERVGLRLGTDEDIMLILESSEPEPVDFSVEELPISAVHLGPGGALVLAGSQTLTIEVLGRQFQVSPATFFQVNTLQAAAMVEHLLQNLRLDGTMTLLDVYSGAGLFSAFLAARVGRLVGIELSPSACIDFAVNLDEFENVELYEASAEDVLTSQQFQPQVIVVDPPRAGLGQRTLDGLLAQVAGQIAYISCDPSTLARDAKRLIAGGYTLRQITPFDLFPHTFHIESISIWEK
jgi:23S rRNA (uracil1939-C5)-methyltransferase